MSVESNAQAHSTARRVRAIWGYSLKAQDQLAKDAGIHKDRFRAIVARSNPNQASPQELLALAQAVGDVPLGFAAVGFDDDPENQMRQAWAEIARLRAEVARLAAIRVEGQGDGLPQPGPELQPPEPTESTTDTSPPQQPKRQAGQDPGS